METEGDVSSALAAAVAAAAEIAKNGFETGLFTTGNTAHKGNNDTSSEARENKASNPQFAVNGSTNQEYQPEPAGQVDLGPGEHTEQDPSASADTEKYNNDLNSVNSAETSAASGEKNLEESEEDAAKRLARSRERNREHARRTRLRKKAQLEALQSKVRGLEAEKKVLKQKIEECSIASILVGLAEPAQEEQQNGTAELLDDTIKKTEKDDEESKISMLTAGKRKRFASVDNSEDKPPQNLKLKIDGETTIIGPKSHINWKSGVYSDENGVQRQLTSEQLENLRRERNRMHAKMTRDRKKNFIATIEKTIEDLERDNQKMRDVLKQVGGHEDVLVPSTNTVTPMASPMISAANSQEEPNEPKQVTPEVAAANSLLSQKKSQQETPFSIKSQEENSFSIKRETKPSPIKREENHPKRQRVAHGFCLSG